MDNVKDEKISFGFNKERLLNNIRAVAKQKNIAIGKLEQDVGVSAGYLSRQYTNTSNPDIGVMQRMAKTLGVTLDDLIEKDLAIGMTATETKIFEFLNRLKNQTHAEKAIWGMYSKDTLNNIEGKEHLEGISTYNLFDVVDTPVDTGSDYAKTVSTYQLVHQLEFGPKAEFVDFQIDGPAYYTQINPTVKLVMTQVRYLDDSIARKLGVAGANEEVDLNDVRNIELYFVSTFHCSPLCNSYAVSEPLRALIEELRDEAKASTKRVQLSDFSLSVIDNYLDPKNHPFKDPNEEMPF